MPISMQWTNNEHVKSIPISIEITYNCSFFSETFSENFAKNTVSCSQVIEYSIAIFTTYIHHCFLFIQFWESNNMKFQFKMQQMVCVAHEMEAICFNLKN